MAYALAGLLLVLNFTPLAAANPSTHTECLGDSDYLHRPTEIGTGCTKATIRTSVDCYGSDDNYTCELWLEYNRAEISGLGTCGNATSPWGTLETEIACVDLSEAPDMVVVKETGREKLRTYTNDSIPDGGKTVVVPGHVCVWPDRTQNVPDRERCHRFPHEERIPDEDEGAGGSPLEAVEDLAKGTIDYAKTTVENAEPPVGVSP